MPNSLSLSQRAPPRSRCSDRPCRRPSCADVVLELLARRRLTLGEGGLDLAVERLEDRGDLALGCARRSPGCRWRPWCAWTRPGPWSPPCTPADLGQRLDLEPCMPCSAGRGGRPPPRGPGRAPRSPGRGTRPGPSRRAPWPPGGLERAGEVGLVGLLQLLLGHLRVLHLLIDLGGALAERSVSSSGRGPGIRPRRRRRSSPRRAPRARAG